MALSILFAPKDASTSPAVDIVAVHGLGGDSVTTWTHPKSKAFWLKDYLPLHIPDARIMTFGYNADAAFGQSTAEVVDHAKSLLVSLVDKREEPEEVNRPLIFIAHSLGGIVVKQALFQARLESRYQSIRDATRGLMLFGTPHRGSDKATYGKVLANIAQFMTNRPPSRLLKALQTNSDVLLRLTSDFHFQLPDYQVYSFYEQRPIKGLSTLIVEKQSALLEVNQEEQIPVDADHSAMCKFETEHDDTFEKVYMRVKRMRKNPQNVTTQQSASYNQRSDPEDLVDTDPAGLVAAPGWTLLHSAVYRQDFTNVRKALSLKLDPNAKTIQHGWTPLWVAACHGNLIISRLLLDAGADVNITSANGRTPLAEATTIGATPLVREFIQQGADVNSGATELDGPPIILAAAKGHSEIVKILLANGADDRAQQIGGFTALHYALMHKHENMAHSLLENSHSFDTATVTGVRPLHLAAIAGFVRAVQRLLDLGADIDAVDKGGLSALRLAVQSTKLDVVKLLLSQSARTDLVPSDGCSLLDIASAVGDFDIYQLVEEHF